MQHWLIYFISDGTGITAESIGHSLLTQFPDLHYTSTTYPYIDTVAKGESIVQEIKRNRDNEHKIMVFSSLINMKIRQTVAECADIYIDLFESYMPKLEQAFMQHATHSIGLTHSTINEKSYLTRIDAVNYALMCDDGLAVNHYDQADVIITGVSRSGKTPTCLYLALTFGIFAANYPMTDDELSQQRLPESIHNHREKLFGLTITPERLQSIRQQRRPDSPYASLEQCKKEILALKTILKHEHIPNLDVSSLSVEEISTKIMREMNLQRHII